MSNVARGAMRYRATIERDVNRDQGAANDWGDQAEPDWRTHLESVPCKVWLRQGVQPGREVQDTKIAVIEDRRMIMPLGIDVTEADRIAKVTDRTGTREIYGAAEIEHVGSRGEYLELILEGP